MKNYILSIFLLGFQMLLANPADSLLNALKTAEGPAKVKIMNELFRAYINSDPVQAIGYSREALVLAKNIDDKKGTAAAYNNLGVAYKNQGALDIALEYYSRSLELYQQIENGEGISITKNNIANIYSLKKDYANALKFFKDSHNGFIALGNTELIIGSLNNLGNLHSELNLQDQAMTYYQDAWKLSDKSGKQFADPLTNIGNLFYRQGNNQRAVEYFLRALEIEKKNNNKIGELALLANLGETYVRAAQPAEAQEYLNQALALEVELKATIYLPQILKSMAANFAQMGKMKEAYATMLQYDEAKESVYGEESTRKIAQMNMTIQLREKETEIEKLQTDDKMKTLQLRNIQFVVTAIVLAIAAIIGVVNVMFLRRKMGGLLK